MGSLPNSRNPGRPPGVGLHSEPEPEPDGDLKTSSCARRAAEESHGAGENEGVFQRGRSRPG